MQTSAERAVAYLNEHKAASVERLIDWLGIPSVGTDPAHRDDTRVAGEWAVHYLRECGVEATLRETGAPEAPGHPIVWAHQEGPAGAPHVLFYGHYDVQPPDPLELWESAPFNPVIKPAEPGGPGERVVARGACDDKGQTLTFLEALRAWKETSGELPVGLTVLIEGEEESGSVNLERFVRDNVETLKRADVCLISDTDMLGRGKPAITYGVRGLCYCEVVLTGPDQDLHSGMWGGRAPNPINELAKILAQIWDADRRVAIPGFYNAVRDVEDAERSAWANLDTDGREALRKIGLGPEADVGEAGYTSTERNWARPTCDINGIIAGYTGEGAKTVIASRASAKVSFRLVADQDPEEVARSFEAWLKERTPPGCSWAFTYHGGGHPATVSTDSPYLQAAASALKAASGVEPALIKSGGSIPVVGMFKSIVGLETLLMGFGLDDDRIHSPNEKFELDCFHLGCATHAALMAELGAMQPA